MQNEKNQRPEAYPQPSTVDRQQEHQHEFIGQEPNDFNDEPVVAPREEGNQNTSGSPDKSIRDTD